MATTTTRDSKKTKGSMLMHRCSMRTPEMTDVMNKRLPMGGVISPISMDRMKTRPKWSEEIP